MAEILRVWGPFALHSALSACQSVRILSAMLRLCVGANGARGGLPRGGDDLTGLDSEVGRRDGGNP